MKCFVQFGLAMFWRHCGGTFHSVAYPATAKILARQLKLQEPLPKVELGFTFRATSLAAILVVAGYVTL